MRKTKGKSEQEKAARYERFKEERREVEAAKSRSGRDIGDIPPVQDAKRRKESEESLRAFCENYLTATFTRAWSEDHLKVIGVLEATVTSGGQYALAMPRGSGKTALVEAAAMWAILTGRRKFVVLLGASKPLAQAMMDSIKSELSCNDLLLADFPEAVYPIHKLEGISNRCTGQLHRGKRTHLMWRDSYIVMPTIDDSAAGGAIIRVAGIRGAVRGMKFKRPAGETQRPDLVLIDDPQTDQSARSVDQCTERERVINGAVLGLAGPDETIAAVMPCTVIRRGDLADRYLDRQLYPQWRGFRTKLLYAMPKNEDLWQEYAEVRANGLRAEDGGAAGNKFYKKHRKRMDAGAVASWPERFRDGELSAIQYAMNLKIDDEASFWAEFQNEPREDTLEDSMPLKADAICAKANAIKPGIVPATMNHVTAMIDVQKRCLYYMVIAWTDRFDGQIVEYGLWPDPKTEYVVYRKVQYTLAKAFPEGGEDGAIYAGLTSLTAHLLDRVWPTSDDQQLRISRCLIDSGNWTELIHRFCRESRHAAIVMPSKGVPIGATERPMAEWQKKPGDRVGVNWRVPGRAPASGTRHVVFDANAWKTFIAARLTTAAGDAGSLALHAGSRSRHRMLAEQLTSEYATPGEGRGRKVEVWKLRPGRPDNHLLDCAVGCAVAGAMDGCSLLAGGGTAFKAKGPRKSMSQMLAEKRRRR